MISIQLSARIGYASGKVDSQKRRYSDSYNDSEYSVFHVARFVCQNHVFCIFKPILNLYHCSQALNWTSLGNLITSSIFIIVWEVWKLPFSLLTRSQFWINTLKSVFRVNFPMSISIESSSFEISASMFNLIVYTSNTTYIQVRNTHIWGVRVGLQ